MNTNEIELFHYSILKRRYLLLLHNEILLIMENSVAIIKVCENIPSIEAINKQEGDRMDINGDDVTNTPTNLNLLHVLLPLALFSPIWHVLLSNLLHIDFSFHLS